MIVQPFMQAIAPSPMAMTFLTLRNNYRPHHHQHDSSSRLFATKSSPLDNFFDDPYSANVKDGTATSSPAAATSESESESDTNTGERTRRVRYNGKYPRDFGDKYKELSGDEATVQKVLNKGMTPAGRHVPILMKECLHHLGLDLLDVDNREGPTFYVDCTLGYGGHSSQVLKRLLGDKNKSKGNRLLGFDRDPIEIVKATERLQQIVHDHDSQLDTNPVMTVNRNFREVRSYLETNSDGAGAGLGQVTALLADLGLSSMQIDDAARGFTYKREGPLDMRMAGNDCNSTTETAHDLLSRITVKQFTKMLQENSDEEHAAVIAQAVLGGVLGSPSKKKKQPMVVAKDIPSTTVELANVVRNAVRPLISPPPPKKQSEDDPPRRDSPKVKKQLDSTVARVMQAIRIEVNSEFESLEELMNDLPHILAPGGRAVVLTFHSGEDRRVKKAFKTGFNNGVYSSWSRDVVRPTAEERRDNPRSSCCKLRWVVRSDSAIVE